MEFSEQQECVVERFIEFIHSDMGIDVVPAKNKKTGKIEVHIIAREPIEDSDEVYIIPLGKLHEMDEKCFDKYKFDFETVGSDVIYERKPWWKFWVTT